MQQAGCCWRWCRGARRHHGDVLEADVDGQTWIEFERGTGTGSFEEGPGTAPLGVGSYVMRTPEDSDKANLKTTAHLGLRLDAIDAMGYQTHRSSESTGQPFHVPAINMEIFTNADGSGTGYTTLVFEPVYQSGGAAAVQTGTWQAWAPSFRNQGDCVSTVASQGRTR